MAFDVPTSPMRPERFRAVLLPDRYAVLAHGAEAARTLLRGRVVWNINSTARGTGVVE